MTDPGNPQRPDDLPDLPEPAAYEQEQLSGDEDAPRRAASARFVVEAQVGSEAAIREAMDPANQSLAEALRLSYRVLQVVIVVLVVLFLASGFETVGDGQSGVHTVFGAIRSVRGELALAPGPQFSFVPYPAGEFIKFDIENRSVKLDETFAPKAGNRTREDMLAQATVANPPQPGGDGALLTREGDMAHLELRATYAIDQPVQFVQRVNDADPARNADRLVMLALQRAAIHVSAGLTLTDLIESSDDVRQRIQRSAQDVLDSLGSGVMLTSVQVSGAKPPMAIENARGEMETARVAADEAIVNARNRANETLNKVAGDQSAALIASIEQYEAALERRDADQAQALLDTINQRLEDPKTSGEVADIIQYARSYQAQIQSTLGNEYTRFASLLPAFRENPRLVVAREWLDVYRKVVSRRDVEIMFVDPASSVRLGIAGSSSIAADRRDASLKRRQEETYRKGITGPYLHRGADMSPGKAGRQIRIDEKGDLKPFGTD